MSTSRASPAAPSPRPWRVVVAGGGPAGLAAAAALAGLGPALDVSVHDPALARHDAEAGRAYAIAPDVRAFLDEIGAWEAIAREAEPVLAMPVSDSRTDDAVRPVYLTFEAGDAEDGGAEPLAHMVEGPALVSALKAAALRHGARLDPSRATAAGSERSDAVVAATGESLVEATLVVAADGARSRWREAAGLGWTGRVYSQLALTAALRHPARDHEGRARQHFLPGGSFALLPLRGRRSSLVWTDRASVLRPLAARMGTAEGRARVLAEIERRAGHALGPLELETEPALHPLGVGVARRFAGRRVALVGDAAHIIHPLAGQGLNLGVRDARALAEAVGSALRLGLDPGAPSGLARFDASRRGAALAMAGLTDGLNRLFSNESLALRLARDLGLGIVDRLPNLKARLARGAADA